MAEASRHYAHSDLAAVADDPDAPLDAGDREVLLALYGQVGTTWRALLDVRFKLLGLVPFVTVAALVVLLPSPEAEGLGGAGAVLCALGAVATLGLWIYDARNSELYDDLISRGRRVEAELGIRTGVFRGRPRPRRPLVRHGTATALIYLSALAGWVYAVAVSLAAA